VTAAQTTARPAAGRRSDRPWLLALGACIVASCLRQLTWAVTVAPELIMRRAPADDAMIYLALAEHAPRPEFTDGILTTGLHPLYWLLLTPVVHLWEGIGAIRAMLVLCIVLHQVSGALLYLAVRTRSSALPAFAAASLWLLLPGPRTLVVMGVETALLACCLAVVLLVLARHPVPSRRGAVELGLAVGVAYLARTDSPLVTLPLVAAWLWPLRRDLRQGARTLATVGVTSFVVALPWLAYLATQGAVFASDAFRAERLGTSVSRFVATEKRALAELYLVNSAGDLRHRLGWVATVLVIVGVALAAWALYRRRDRIALAGLGGPVLLFIAYGSLQGYMRDWYLGYPLFAVCAFIVPLLAELVPRRAAVPALVVVLVGSILVPNHVLNPQEGDKYQAAPLADERLPPGARVGAFNAGTYQFLMDADVVNLDGVVNRHVLGPKRAGRLCDYLVAEGIDHLLDTTVYLEENQRADPRLRFTETIDLDQVYDPDRVHVDQDQVLATVDLDRCREPR